MPMATIKHVPKCQNYLSTTAIFFSDWPIKSGMVTKFDQYGALMIGATNRFDCVPFNTAAVSINWLQYLLQMLEALLRFGHVNYLIPKKMFKFFGVF